jgi:hypothetical protein
MREKMGKRARGQVSEIPAQILQTKSLMPDRLLCGRIASSQTAKLPFTHTIHELVTVIVATALEGCCADFDIGFSCPL